MIGIFGGTFDPVHYGHLRTVREVYRELALTEVRFIPASQPPHRQTPVASGSHRLAMVRLALEKEPGFVADNREYLRDKPSYTVDTLHELQKAFPDATLCLIIGADSLITLETWHRWQELFDLCHIIAMTRPGYDVEQAAGSNRLSWLSARLCRDKQKLRQQRCGCIYLQAVTEQSVSATGIRNAIAAGESIDNMVPAAVATYINQEHLYQ